LKKSIQKEWATSLVTYIFLVIGITGVMMFFHILDVYTKQMHEILGLAFVVAAALHIWVNFKSMKNYFSNHRFLFSGVFISSLVLIFILNTQNTPSVKGMIFNSVLEGELSKVIHFLNIDETQAKKQLQQKGIDIQNFDSLRSIAKANKTSPFEILAIMVNKNPTSKE
jgi:membrane protease YdiL (CAAX protease family)